MRTKYGLNLLTFVAGGWLLLSPWVMNYHQLGYAAWSAVMVGTVLMLSEFMAFIRPGPWEEVLDIGLGSYLVASPFLLGFTVNTAVANNAYLVGLLVIALAIVGLMKEDDVQRWWHDHMHHSS